MRLAVSAARFCLKQLDATLATLGQTVSNVKNRLLSEFLPAISNVATAFSGMLSADEYARLLQSATNTTMQRVIRHYAAQAAVDLAKKYGDSDQRAREMRAVSFEYGDEIGNKLAQFDVLSDVFRRATNNPGMIDHWEELTGEITEGF